MLLANAEALILILINLFAKGLNALLDSVGKGCLRE